MPAQQSASMEDYLEAIAVLRREGYPVRVSQISKALDVKMPSVTCALRKLSEDGLVKHERYGHVDLTVKGRRIAGDVLRRHEALRQFLVEILKVDPDTAAKDACGMEHSISPDTAQRLGKFVEFVCHCPRGEPEWVKGFDYYFEHGERSEACMEKCQRE